MPLKDRLAFFLLGLAGSVFGAEPFVLDGSEIDGEYLGTYLEFLSEGDLFPVIKSDWSADEVFIEKVASGDLSSDSRFLVAKEEIPGGYRYHAILRESGRNAAIEWGLAEILRPGVRRLFRPFETAIPTCDFTPHSGWLSFSVDNRSSSGQTVYLELDKYLFSSIDLFYSIEGISVERRLAFVQPMADRRVKNRNMTVRVDLPVGETSFVARVDSWYDDVVPLRVWSEESYDRYLARDNAILGFISGVFVLLFLYSVFASLSARSRSYLYLAALTLCTFIVHLTVSGFGFQHLWPGNPATGVALFYGAFSLSMVFTLQLCRSYIPKDHRTDLLNAYVFVLAGGIAITTAVMFAVPFSVQSRIFSVLFFLDHIYYLPLLVPAITALRRNDRTGFFLLFALVIYPVSQAEWIVTNRNIIPYSLVYYLNVKSILFVALIAAGLHYKFRAMSERITDYTIRLKEISERINSKVVTDQTKRKIGEVKEFIKDNYTEDISRDGLASAVGMSPDHLGRVFKQSEGVTLGDFTNSLRIQEAADLLRSTTERKIIDIAFTVGFSSLRTFNKVFLETYRVTPREYRQRGGAITPTSP